MPGILCAAESAPEFMTALHEWQAEMARPGQQAARDLPEDVRRILAIEPTERDEAGATALANYFRTHRHPAAAPAKDRVAAARAARGEAVRARFREAGIDYPSRGIFIRAFKHEAELELWARGKDDTFRKVATYAITAASGGPGPKRREGDGQVPEGCYAINVFNPASRFHLSLGLNYPNESDRVLADRARPGGEIFIHGGAASIGCLPLGDAGIEEVYLIALDARAAGQGAIPVHIFPARMSGPAWKEFAQRESGAHPQLAAFWENLRRVHDAFENTHRLTRIDVAKDGGYRVHE